ncbi:hypothetical protein ACQR16_12185 [Bradyrhizobium oligotrophicum]|uniref:hypothetical protein n=1 Tax=Bradyrhizobium oligotrophicum TaxID=44255 RepID=UPI003EBB6182
MRQTVIEHEADAVTAAIDERRNRRVQSGANYTIPIASTSNGDAVEALAARAADDISPRVSSTNRRGVIRRDVADVRAGGGRDSRVASFSPESCILRATLEGESRSRRRRDQHSFRMTFFNSVRDTI